MSGFVWHYGNSGGRLKVLAAGLDVLVLEQASSCAPSLELGPLWIIFLDYYTKGQQAEEEMAAQMLTVAVREDEETWCWLFIPSSSSSSFVDALHLR